MESVPNANIQVVASKKKEVIGNTNFSFFESDSINFSKLLGLIIQTVCFRIVIILVDCLLHHELELKRILLSLFPVNYFVVLYVVLMILAPYINRLISTLSTKAFTTLVIILFSIFSVYVTFVDVMKEVSLDELQGLSSVGLYGSMNGYSIVNFVLVYIIGVWLKRNNIVDKVKTRHVILGLLISVLAIYALRMFSDSALNYSNPILIIEGCLYFCLFGKLKISSKVINSLAKASFTSFLINSNILGFVGDRFIANKSTLVIVLALVFETLLIYGLGYVAMLLWNLISKPFFKLVINKIPIYKLKTVK